jgi:hypothetical protein
MKSRANSSRWLVNFLIFPNAFLAFSALIPGGAFIIAQDGRLIWL